MDVSGFDDEPPPEPRDGWLLVRIHVPELNIFKSLQFPSENLIWDVKQQCLASLPKELKESFNYGLFCPPSNGKAGKFLDEERRLADYPFNGPIGYLELKYKRRVYKMLNLDERQLKSLHTRANLRRFIECINSGHVEKIAKMCTKGLDPNFHCSETGETPLTLATGTKKPNKILIALVNGGAILDYRTKDGITALHRAVERDCLEAISTLLELGASPNYRDTKGLTPVYITVTKKTDPKICEVLLHDHATLGTQDTQGWQEVHQACRNGLVHHLEHLLFYGADMDSRNASGNTPLHVCAVNNQEACARMLLFRGAQRGALNFANQTPYQVAVIAGNLELAEMIQNYKSDDIVLFRGPPRYNPRRRSGLGWGATLSRSGGPPSPCPSELPFSSASSSLSEGSSSHRSHEDDISIVTDKSLGDTSDVISDSSGVGTNSESAACSIGHPSTTVVCMEAYNSQLSGHLKLQPGDVIEVVGSTDCGLLEGFVRGSNHTGFFPAHIVQEVQFRQKNITNVSISGMHHQTQQKQLQLQQQQQQQQMQIQQQQNQQYYQNNNIQSLEHAQYNSSTAPRIKRSVLCEPRIVVLHRAKRGFGFILRGAKASSPLMQLKPSPRCPALQYLDDVDPGGVADMAGLKPGDFLLLINGEDVTCASHEHVVELIRNSGALVSMSVMTVTNVNPQLNDIPIQGMGTPSSTRQCATLPRRMNALPGGKMPAPIPPRRDPRTTLSVGRARAKSMVAGLEGGIEKDDDDDSSNPTKSNSVESIHQQSQSAVSTPTQAGPGTPVQPRTASIKARPTSSRISAAELEELFQRQQGADENRCSTMMSSSRFQSGVDSGAPTPPTSPQKGPIVYASVADMKRKKTKTGSSSSTLRGRPCSIPAIGSDLRRNFHSTPDLAFGLNSNVSSSIWCNTVGYKGHRSQEDVHSLHLSMQRLNLPPPNHPPPPPPVGQVVKVAVPRNSEYESTLALQKKVHTKKSTSTAQPQPIDTDIMSSFKPASNAKLYASPQDIRNIGYRSLASFNNNDNNTNNNSNTNTIFNNQNNNSSNVKNNDILKLSQPNTIINRTATNNSNPYAQPGRPGGASPAINSSITIAAPPIPDPDYSLSESDSEAENSVRLASRAFINDSINCQSCVLPEMAAETSGNSNTSGSSTGSSSMPHSFSVDEIQKIRTTLKSSKSYPNDFLLRQQQKHLHDHNEEGDNSSSGVSSDQDIPNNVGTEMLNTKSQMQKMEPKIKMSMNAPAVLNLPSTINEPQKKVVTIVTNDNVVGVDDSPSPPAKGFQRHNSLTRKQAATLAAQRTKSYQQQQQQLQLQQHHQQPTRHAVSLIQLPPPMETELEDGESALLPPPVEYEPGRQMGGYNYQQNQLLQHYHQHQQIHSHQQQQYIQQQTHRHHRHHQHQCHNQQAATNTNNNTNTANNNQNNEIVVLAPPPEFCDIVDNNPRVRIVGAVPKINRMHSQ